MQRPIVALPTCRHTIEGLAYDCTQHKYIHALHQCAGVLPLQIPLLREQVDVESLFARIDGIFLTGSHSNIHPSHYGSDNSSPEFRLDPDRDVTVLPLIKPALERGIPLFAVCRGFQELNVAFGGTIATGLDTIDHLLIHKEDHALPLEERYGDVHVVKLTPGGRLQDLLGTDSVRVNSLHNQGIDTLGAGLIVEAHAEDGLVEAVGVADSPGFALGVQWHPEWKAADNPVSAAIYAAFGEACRKHLTEK